ncbi:Glutamyl-tRNA reductase-binding protein, chloroplastic [Linum grandiflorum]
MHLQSQAAGVRSSSSPHIPLYPLISPRPISHFHPSFPNPQRPKFSLKCSASAVALGAPLQHKPLPAEVSRTIVELSSVATLSAITEQGWPLGIGVPFAVDAEDGTPILCLTDSHRIVSLGNRSSLNVRLEQNGIRTAQCTIQGSLVKPEDSMRLKSLTSTWRKRFGEEVEEGLVYIVDVEKVLQMEDFMEDGMWVSSLDYKSALPDPLRNSAEALVKEINANNMEDVYRFCNVYVDLDFQVTDAKMIWIDRLGFDLRITSSQKGSFDVRIPFPREVTDERGAKSSFNGMSQLAWEVEKNYQAPNFEKVKQLKQIA